MGCDGTDPPPVDAGVEDAARVDSGGRDGSAGDASPGLCGNSTVDPLEDCDDGRNGDPTDGCTDQCRYSCVSDEDCGFVEFATSDDCSFSPIDGFDISSCANFCDLGVAASCPAGTMCAPDVTGALRCTGVIG